MTEAKFILISKLDAAKRQLEHAIKLFFRNGDTVVIHSLTSASYKVLRDLCRKQNIQSVFLDEAMKMIKLEKREEVKKMFYKAENYFKHADRDSEKLLKFYYPATEFHIWDACIMYVRLTKETVPYFALYQFWFYTKNPEIFVNNTIRDNFISVSKNYHPENRSQYLELLPEIEAIMLK